MSPASMLVAVLLAAVALKVVWNFVAVPLTIINQGSLSLMVVEPLFLVAAAAVAWRASDTIDGPLLMLALGFAAILVSYAGGYLLGSLLHKGSR